jgi:hypothetical protein
VYDCDREEKLQQRKMIQFSVNPSIAMALPVSFGCTAAAAAHQAYAELVSQSWAQVRRAVRMFKWRSTEEQDLVCSQLYGQGASELQYFEQMDLESLPSGRHFNTHRVSEKYRNAHLHRSSTGARCGSSIAVSQDGGSIIPATALAFACAFVCNLDGQLVALPLLLMEAFLKIGTASFGQNILASTVPYQRLLVGISPGVVLR